MCSALKVRRSGFYAWRKRTGGGTGASSARAVRQRQLLAKIRKVHAENRELYGSPRVHRALLIDGELVSRNTVAKLMRQAKIRAKSRRRFVPRTTDSTHRKPVADNLLDRDFTAPAPNTKWLADITYVATAEGWLFLAAVLDCFSRKIVGWSMSEAMPAELVADALNMALLNRDRAPPAPAPGGGGGGGGGGGFTGSLLLHSDRGSQYASDQFQNLLAHHWITPSMSRSGDCYDNAMMESFWATLKTELIHLHKYATREQARQSIFEYIEVFYNRKRLHSSLGYLSPESFEAA
jgi:transposase InsO family protein